MAQTEKVLAAKPDDLSFLGPTWWKMRTDSHKSSELHMDTVHIYTYKIIIKKILNEKYLGFEPKNPEQTQGGD